MNRIVVFIISITLYVVSVNAKDYVITNFGAVGDGQRLNTSSIQKAIDEASKAGGGKVIFPNGKFLSGSIVLKSNVELHLSKKAVLLGSTNIEHYIKLKRWKALVMAEGAQNISISGKGTIDGQGDELAINIIELFHAGKIDSSDYNFREDRPSAVIRPQLIEFRNCTNVVVSDVTLRDAASWVQTYQYCNNLVIHKIKVISDAFWNNDGMDILDCKNVSITHCYVNAADDGICLKSEDFSKKRFSDSIYIANCVVRSSASAVKFGTSTVSAIRNVVIENIKVYDTYRSAIAIESMQDGVVENVLVNNIKAKNTGNAIFIRIGRIRNAPAPGILRNITISNVKVSVPFNRPDFKYNMRGPALPYFHNVFPSSITGIPGYKVENVVLKNIKIVYPGRGNKSYAYAPVSRLNDIPELETAYPEFSMFGELPAWGFYVRHVNGLTMENIQLKIKHADYRPAMVFDDVQNLNLVDYSISGDAKSKLIIKQNTSSN